MFVKSNSQVLFLWTHLQHKLILNWKNTHDSPVKSECFWRDYGLRDLTKHIQNWKHEIICAGFLSKKLKRENFSTGLYLIEVSLMLMPPKLVSGIETQKSEFFKFQKDNLVMYWCWFGAGQNTIIPMYLMNCQILLTSWTFWPFLWRPDVGWMVVCYYTHFATLLFILIYDGTVVCLWHVVFEKSCDFVWL